MHITMAGKLGSGKSTVAKLLSDKYGFEIYSTGKIQRELARSFGVSTLEMNEMMKSDVKYDHMIDDEVTRISIDREADKLLFDSRMAWHFAKNSFKVFFTIDPQIAAVRVMADPRGAEETYESTRDAKEKLLKRSLVENERFKEIYKTDNLDYNNYDLVIDTSHMTREGICELVYNEYIKFCDSPETYGKAMYFSPKSLYPTLDINDCADDIGVPVKIFCDKNYNFISHGHMAVIECAKSGADYVKAVVEDLDVSDELRNRICNTSVSILRSFEKAGGFDYPSVPSQYTE